MFQTLKTLAGMFQSDDVTPARRNQTTLGVHSLEAREVPAVVSSTFLDPFSNAAVLQLTGNGAADTIKITHNGAGGVTLTGVSGVTSFTLIDRIVVDLGGGDDRVTFQQGTPTAVVSQSRNLSVKVDLGDGDDQFIANLHGELQAGRRLKLDVNGGLFGFDGENDVIDVRSGAAGAGFAVQAGAIFTVKMAGGGGADTLKLTTEGQLDGTLILDMSGGDGNDTLHVNADPDPGSTGRLEGEGGGRASIRGDGGNDNVFFRFDLDGASSAKANVILDGGWLGTDTLEIRGDNPGSDIDDVNFEVRIQNG